MGLERQAERDQARWCRGVPVEGDEVRGEGGGGAARDDGAVGEEDEGAARELV